MDNTRAYPDRQTHTSQRCTTAGTLNISKGKELTIRKSVHTAPAPLRNQQQKALKVAGVVEAWALSTQCQLQHNAQQHVQYHALQGSSGEL